MTSLFSYIVAGGGSITVDLHKVVSISICESSAQVRFDGSTVIASLERTTATRMSAAWKALKGAK